MVPGLTSSEQIVDLLCRRLGQALMVVVSYLTFLLSICFNLLNSYRTYRMAYSEQRAVPTMIQPDLSDPVMQMKGQKEDPDSIASLSTRAQVMQAQSMADSRYDPSVPSSGSPRTKAPFLDFGAGQIAHDNIKTRITLFIAGLILILFICWYVNPKSTVCGLTSLIKLPSIFRR